MYSSRSSKGEADLFKFLMAATKTSPSDTSCGSLLAHSHDLFELLFSILVTLSQHLLAIDGPLGQQILGYWIQSLVQSRLVHDLMRMKAAVKKISF